LAFLGAVAVNLIARIYRHGAQKRPPAEIFVFHDVNKTKTLGARGASWRRGG